MTVDPTVLPGLLLLAAELGVLAAVGYVVVRVALRQDDDRVALAQGLVVGPAIWGLIVNLVTHAVPGLAGAIVGWGVTLAVGAVLAWRASHPIRPRPRVVAGIGLALLVLLPIALASRQLLSIPDATVHLGLAASIRAGGFPPAFFWTPDIPASYHYGTGLLIGLLAPPFGPNLAFTTEVLDVWMWACLVLVVVTALLQRESKFSVLITAPLLLTAGAWTFIFVPVDIVRVPLPAGIPAAGIRASLTDIYWPSAALPVESPSVALPDIWRFVSTLAYALAFVVLAHAAQAGRRSWPAALTLAGLVGFLALLTTTLAPMVLVLWTVLEAATLVQCRRAGFGLRALSWSVVGPALAVLLLAVGGGTLTSALTDSVSTGLSVRWTAYPGVYRPLGSFDELPGGIALLRGGPVVIAGVAALLGRRDRLVLAFAVGACALTLASVALGYDPAALDLGRFAGHARNFALLALVLALGARLSALPSMRWRYAVSALLVLLVTWPTVVGPVRNLGLAITQGVAVANASPSPRQPSEWLPHRGRFEMPHLSDRIAAYIRDRTRVDARVLSTARADMSFATISFATGRPNASGFVNHLHFLAHTGPEYLDAIRHLEPAAIRRLGLDYIYATDAWVAGLPDRATRWLSHPDLFEVLVPRRRRDALSGAAGVPETRPGTCADIVRSAASGSSGGHHGLPTRAIPDGGGAARGVGAVPYPADRRPGPVHAAFAYALANGAPRRAGAGPRDRVAAGRAVDVSVRWTAPDLVERRDCRLCAGWGHRPDHAAAAQARAAARQRLCVGRAGRGWARRLHRHLRQPRAGAMDRPGVGRRGRGRFTVGYSDASECGRSHTSDHGMVCRPDPAHPADDHPDVSIRHSGAQPDGAG